MSWWGWPDGPATRRQYALIRRLAIACGRPVPPALNEWQASRYIDELRREQWRRERA